MHTNSTVKAIGMSRMIVESVIINPLVDLSAEYAFLVRSEIDSQTVGTYFCGSGAGIVNLVEVNGSIGDLNIMQFPKNFAAFNVIPKSKNIEDFVERINLLKIETNFPDCPVGYAYLSKSGILVYNWREEKYECTGEQRGSNPDRDFIESWRKIIFQSASDTYVSFLQRKFINDKELIVFSGRDPKLPFRYCRDLTKNRAMRVKLALCVRCLDWPPEAMLWSNRGRRHGWPSSETIQEVLKTGCDLIPESHRDHSRDRF